MQLKKIYLNSYISSYLLFDRLSISNRATCFSPRASVIFSHGCINEMKRERKKTEQLKSFSILIAWYWRYTQQCNNGAKKENNFYMNLLPLCKKVAEIRVDVYPSFWRKKIKTKSWKVLNFTFEAFMESVSRCSSKKVFLFPQSPWTSFLFIFLLSLGANQQYYLCSIHWCSLNKTNSILNSVFIQLQHFGSGANI